MRRSDSEESLEERKALESIDEEIKTITKPSKPKQKVDKLALKALASFGKEASEKMQEEDKSPEQDDEFDFEINLK